MDQKISVGLVYIPNGILRKNQVILSVEDAINFIKAPIWEEDGKIFIGLAGGGDCDEIKKVVKHMSPTDIEKGLENFNQRAVRER